MADSRHRGLAAAPRAVGGAVTERLAQAVEITLSDGRVGVFLGRMLVTQADADRAMVRGVKFYEARPLPDGVTWGELNEEAGRKP